MKRKTVSAVMLALLLTSMLTLAFGLQPVKATGTIYIRADGSIGPPTAPILQDGNIYAFTNNAVVDELTARLKVQKPTNPRRFLLENRRF